MEHYCDIHSRKYFRNEKNRDDGSLSVWYSHKNPDGSYCNEKVPTEKVEEVQHQIADMTKKRPDSMLVCNASNNATTFLIANGLPIADFPIVFHAILTVLESNA